MSPESMESYRQIQESLQNMEREIGKLRESQARIEVRLDSAVQDRADAREVHRECRRDVDEELDALEAKYNHLLDCVNRLTTWGRALAIVGSIFITVLTILNILLSVGIKV